MSGSANLGRHRQGYARPAENVRRYGHQYRRALRRGKRRNNDVDLVQPHVPWCEARVLHRSVLSADGYSDGGSGWISAGSRAAGRDRSIYGTQACRIDHHDFSRMCGRRGTDQAIAYAMDDDAILAGAL